MRVYLTLLVLIISNPAYPQMHDSINYVDSRGKKQGNWIYYKYDTVFLITDTIPLPRDNNNTVNVQSDPINWDSLHMDTLINKYVHKRGSFRNDKKTGIWKIYTDRYYYTDHQNIEPGVIKYEIPFKNDKINGTVKTYYPTGSMKSELNFVKGIITGEIKYYDKTGFLKYRGKFTENNPEVTVEELLPDGSYNKNVTITTEDILNNWTNISELKQ